jgi:hypothetical protein
MSESEQNEETVTVREMFDRQCDELSERYKAVFDDENYRKRCSECGVETEFVQFGGEDSVTTETDPEDVGDGLLELRICNECSVAIENILTVESTTVFKPTL